MSQKTSDKRSVGSARPSVAKFVNREKGGTYEGLYARGLFGAVDGRLRCQYDARPVAQFDGGAAIDAAVAAIDAATPDAAVPPPDAGPPVTPPLAYVSACDSPYALAGMNTDAFLETFEDSTLDTVGIEASAGAPFGSGGLTDSVDGDDGTIDGSGTNGHSFFSSSGSTGITFTFDADAIGFAPTYVGVAWTDGAGTTNFEAFDTDGNSLGASSGTHATGGFTGQTDEDRFYGAENAAGVGSIHISNTSGGIEVDHVQFGRPSADDGDCNGNSTPDKCELVGNDANGNNIPDDCEE